MGYTNRLCSTDGSPYELAMSRRKALELLPMLRERDKDKKPVRIDDRTIILKRQ